MKKNIAVIFGGKSAEHDVSIITAHFPIIESLLASGQYNVIPVYISKKGVWYSDDAMLNMNYFKDKDYEQKLSKLKGLILDVNDGLSLIWTGAIKNKLLKIDLAFPAMHGTFGEDGSLMGLLRMAGVPFVGCDLIASAVAMDKAITKQVLAAEGVPVVPFVWFSKADWAQNSDEFKKEIKKLNYPLFVKPVHLGSSIAITKVSNERELVNAIEVALHYDDKVLVEEGVQDLIEVTLPMVGNDTVEFANIERPLNKSEFFDFSDKYLSGGKKVGGSLNSKYSELPAKLDDKIEKQVFNFGEKTYKTLGCTGIARVDFLINSKDGKVYVNEVNTLPGGLYDHNFRSKGVSNMDLVLKLVKLAEDKFEAESKTTYTFNSNILSNLDGAKFSKE